MILRYKHLECARTMCWPVHTRNRDNIYLCCGHLLRIAYEEKKWSDNFGPISTKVFWLNWDIPNISYAWWHHRHRRNRLGMNGVVYYFHYAKIKTSCKKLIQTIHLRMRPSTEHIFFGRWCCVVASACEYIFGLNESCAFSGNCERAQKR